MHSTHSYDGKVPLRELKEQLKTAGVSFACMSEHTDELTPETAAAFVAECRELSDESFVFVPGFEVPYRDAHILMLGCTSFVSQIADASQLRAWRAAAALAILAHPVRNRFLLDEVMREVIDGVEVWNQQYDGKRVLRPRAWKLLRVLRKERAGLIATGGLDLHRPEHLTYPRVTLRVAKLSEAAILDALKNGAFEFGTATCRVPAKGEWVGAGKLGLHIKSAVSIAVIGLGKTINGALAKTGLSLPRGLRRAIRARV